MHSSLLHYLLIILQSNHMHKVGELLLSNHEYNVHFMYREYTSKKYRTPG